MLKVISGKRKKTDSDFEEMARIEWYGSLYLMNGKPCIPGEVLEATFVSAAKKSKNGTNAKMGAFCPDNFPLEFEGDDLTLDELWEGENHRLTSKCKIGTSSVMRTRPKFDKWAADCSIVFDDEIFNERDVLSILETAGRYIGTMDWRPRYGRFTVSHNGKHG